MRTLTRVHRLAYDLQVVHSDKLLIALPPGEHTVVTPSDARIVQPTTDMFVRSKRPKPTHSETFHQRPTRTSYQVPKSCIAIARNNLGLLKQCLLKFTMICTPYSSQSTKNKILHACGSNTAWLPEKTNSVPRELYYTATVVFVLLCRIRKD